MITPSEAILIQDIIIEKFGGIRGIRDRGLLESALSRPFQTFDNKDLYPSILHKSAALVESIVINHPFLDGNKRIGYVLMRLFLIENGYDLNASQDDKYDFVIKIASGLSDLEQIHDWISQHTEERIRH